MKHHRMHVAVVSFPAVPPIGTAIELEGGQKFELVGARDYLKADGSLSAVLSWATVCPDTGEQFTVETGMTLHDFPARRGPSARQPGKAMRRP